MTVWNFLDVCASAVGGRPRRREGPIQGLRDSKRNARETYQVHLRRRVASHRVFFFCHGLNLRIYSQPLKPSACLDDSQHEVPVWYSMLTITARLFCNWRCRLGDVLLFYVHLIVLLNLNLLGLALVRLCLLLYFNSPGCFCETRLSHAR